jgi:transcriptional regulator with XRE-family HTH domain
MGTLRVAVTGTVTQAQRLPSTRRPSDMTESTAHQCSTDPSAEPPAHVSAERIRGTQRWTTALDGLKLRQLRHQHGLSQERLADLADISLTTLARLERHHRSPCRTYTLARIAAALGEPAVSISFAAPNADVIRAIDDSISQGELRLRDFEIRVSRVRRWDRAGEHPQAEIGVLGTRFTSYPSSRLVAYRMLKLLHRVYYESDIFDAADLAYAIEASNDLNDGELLDRAVREYSVGDLFSKLILPNRRVVGLAAQELNLFDYENLSGEQRLERLRWKIGEPAAIGFKDLDRIDEYLPKVEEANDEKGDEGVIRASASNLFTAVESALTQALIFSTWAFSSDHYMLIDGFVYDPLTNPAIVEFIETNAPTEIPELRLKHDEGNTLVPLGAGFARLAKALRKLNEKDYVRPSGDIPTQCVAWDGWPKRWPGRSTYSGVEDVLQESSGLADVG